MSSILAWTHNTTTPWEKQQFVGDTTRHFGCELGANRFFSFVIWSFKLEFKWWFFSLICTINHVFWSKISPLRHELLHKHGHSVYDIRCALWRLESHLSKDLKTTMTVCNSDHEFKNRIFWPDQPALSWSYSKVLEECWLIWINSHIGWRHGVARMQSIRQIGLRVTRL